MNLGNVNITGVHFRDLKGPPTDIKHIIADIVIIDKTDHDAVYPLVYQVKQTTASEVNNSPHFNTDWLRSQEDAFVLLGEYSKTEKDHKLVHLMNDMSVSYNYLIVVTGNKGTFITPNQTLEFTAGIQTLIDALKMRRQGLMPQSLPKATKQMKKITLNEESQKDVELVAQKNMHAVEQDLNAPQLPDSKLHFQVNV